jgi:hypothetical protein
MLSTKMQAGESWPQVLCGAAGAIQPVAWKFLPSAFTLFARVVPPAQASFYSTVLPSRNRANLLKIKDRCHFYPSQVSVFVGGQRGPVNA